MMNKLSKYTLFFITLIFLSACGEVTVGEKKQLNRPQATNVEGVSETIKQTLVLKNIMNSIQTMDTNSSNKEQYSEIIKWLENITNEVNELTAKDFRTLVENFKNSELFYLSDNIYSTDNTLQIYEGGKATFIGLNPSKGGSFVLLNKSSDIANVQNSIIVCSGDLNISHSHNNIIIVNGKLDIGMDGVTEDQNTDEGSIIYNKGDVNVSHSYGSVFLFENHIETSFIYDGSCINTGITNSSNGQCTEIKTETLTED